MSNPRILIAGGCSFTQVPNSNKNWPLFLRDKIGLHSFFEGSGSAGNDFISRRTIYRVIECLKQYKPKDLLVGVMWSGVSRKSFYLDEPPAIDFGKFGHERDSFNSNPNRIGTSKINNVYLVLPNDDSRFSEFYYKTYYSKVGSLIESIEHVLRLQWFLKSQGIRYFFTEYTSDSVTGNYKCYDDKNDVKYLYDQIDFSQYLPVDSMQEWILDYPEEFKFPTVDTHPTSMMSEAFTERVIIPHLKNKGYIV